MSSVPIDPEELEDEDFELRKSDLEDTEMDITPMIDITFLLLIFFIVASKMQESAAVDLPNATSGIFVLNDEAIAVVIKKSDGGISEVSLTGTRTNEEIDEVVAATSEEEQEEKIRSIIAEHIKPEGEDGYHEILLKGEKNVKNGEITRVAKAIKSAAEQVEIFHVAVMKGEDE